MLTFACRLAVVSWAPSPQKPVARVRGARCLCVSECELNGRVDAAAHSSRPADALARKMLTLATVRRAASPQMLEDSASPSRLARRAQFGRLASQPSALPSRLERLEATADA